MDATIENIENVDPREAVLGRVNQKYQSSKDLADWFSALSLSLTPRQGPFTSTTTLWMAYNTHREHICLAALRQTSAHEYNKVVNESLADRQSWLQKSHTTREFFFMKFGEFLYSMKGWTTQAGLRKCRGYYNIQSPHVPTVTTPFADRPKNGDITHVASTRPLAVTRAQDQSEATDGMYLRLYHTREQSTRKKASKSEQAKSVMMSPRYMNEFVAKLECAGEMLDLKLFPDAGEISESMAVFNAVRRHIDAKRQDSNVALVSVGDGSTPRSAAMFAYRTGWQCHSVDPCLPVEGTEPHQRFSAIQRLTLHPKMIEQFTITADRVILLLVHAHVDLCTVLRSINSTNGVFSPDRTIRVWKHIDANAFTHHNSNWMVKSSIQS